MSRAAVRQCRAASGVKAMRSLLFAAAAVAVTFSAAPARADFADLYASKIVVIPVQIDRTGLAPIDLARLQAFYGAGGTFAHYFAVASGGKFQADVTIAPLVEYKSCPASLGAACAVDGSSLSTLGQSVDFARDVFQRAHDEGRVDFSAFDVNGFGGQPDGVLDGAVIVVNLPGAGVALPIEYVNSGSNLNGGNGGALVLDKVRVPYCAVASQSGFAALRAFGETLGLADLRYLHPSSGDRYPAWGGLHFSLAGDADDAASATLPDAESRRALGWQQHRVISGSREVTLQPAAAGGDAVKLGMMISGRQEYFLAEARGPADGIDTSIVDARGNPTWGLALYHIDWSHGPKARTGEWTSRMLFCLDCDPFHPFVRNLESSGSFGLIASAVSNDQVLFESGQSISSIASVPPLSPAYRYVATNYYDGTSSGISIANVRVNPDHSVTATFHAPVVADPCADVSCAPLEACVSTGAQAGNCALIDQSGLTGNGSAGAHASEQGTSGCSSTGGSAISFLCFAGMLLVLRRRR
jgi:hypothetical protein